MPAWAAGGVCVNGWTALLAGEARRGAWQKHLGKVSLAPLLCRSVPPLHCTPAPAQASSPQAWKFATGCSPLTSQGTCPLVAMIRPGGPA